MNTERLISVLQAVSGDLQKTELPNALKQVRDALQNQVNQPQQATHQQQVTAHLERLLSLLTDAPSNRFAPTWQQVAEKIGAWSILGDRLAADLTATFQRNQITPSAALEQVRALYDKVTRLSEAVNGAIKALDHLGLGPEELPPGSAELGVLIPRNAVKNQLGGLGQELKAIDRILGTFAELVTGQRPGFAIRTVSSTDLSLFLDMTPAIAACVAVAAERIVSLYKQLLEIRRLRRDLAKEDVPAEALKSVDDHANSVMEEGLGTVASDLLEKYWKGRDGGRRNELRMELRTTLNQIANRIDRGYNIEVRVQELPTDAKEEEAAAVKEDVTAIQAATKTLQFLKLEGDPILRLPEASDDEKKKK